MSDEQYDLAIVGSGVTGAALLYVLAAYSSVKRIVLLEQYNSIGTVSSHHTQNSQTLHFGDIETNYTVEKATAVKAAAEMVARYCDALPEGNGVFVHQQKMVIAVGADEVATLRTRYDEIRSLFPKLQLLERDAIATVEPAVMDGRIDDEPMVALFSENGYAVNYGALARSLVFDAMKKARGAIDVMHGVRVDRIERSNDGFTLRGSGRSIAARTVVVAAGAHSLSLAHRMGEGSDLSLIPVAGLFYTAKNRLRGKVYTVQHPKLPFAAIHGDPDVSNAEGMRFGPIAKAFPLLELRKWRTMIDFLRVFPLSVDTIKSVIAINADRVVRRFITRNFWYDVPVIGARLFVREARKIVPTMSARDITFGKHLGGIRPQVVNIRTHTMQMGEAKIVGDRILYNITPSPGASVCLANAVADARMITAWLGASLDDVVIARDLGSSEKES